MTLTIPDQIARHLEAITALCRRFHVTRLELVGSAATGSFNPASSDFDFLVEFDYQHPGFRALRDLFGLKEALEVLPGRSVDLVSRSAIKNPYLKSSVDAQRVHLFAA